MGISDRRYDGDRYDAGGGRGGGGVRGALRRMFVEGDDFFSWSLPLGRVPRGVPLIGGIEIRIHLLYVVFIIAELVWAARPDVAGPWFKAMSMATLFVLVLIHEFGHCAACRLVGGEANRILMWPLGGLASCNPPHEWRASLITTLGGPATHLVLIGPVLVAVMAGLGAGLDVFIYNPLAPESVWRSAWFVTDAAYWKFFLWSAYHANLTLFLFNMLLVMFPMDAGRVFQELLWSRLGYSKSMRIATSVGIGMAVAVGAFGLISGTSTLLGIAIFAGITCWNEKRKLAFTEMDPAMEVLSQSAAGERKYQAALAKQQRETRERAAKAESRRASDDAAHRAEVDRILDKIRREGMGSLTRGERKSLESETERKRAGGS
jgi:stage IV sporulation protein FB